MYFGFSRGLGAVFGLLGTSVYLSISSVFKSTERSGVVAIWLFWIILFPGVVSFYLSGESRITDFVLMGSMAAGRIGLWSYDLVITQLVQDNVAETERGIFSSIQRASYQMFFVVMQVLGMIFYDPRQFIILVTFSVVVVLGAAVIYTVWYLFYSQSISQGSDSKTFSGDTPYAQLGSTDGDDCD